MVWGIVVVAGLLSIGWVLTAIGATESMALSDRIAVYRTAELIRLISGVRGLEHLERPDYLNPDRHPCSCCSPRSRPGYCSCR